MLRVYLIKIIQKLMRLTKKVLPPMKVLPLEDFYAQKYTGDKPTSEYFKDRKNPQFFFNPSNFESYVHQLKSKYPQAVEQTIERAEKAIEHTFDLLGSGETNLGKQIDWHKDFIANKSWQNIHHSKIKIINRSDDSDIKVPWELSRLQHFTDIGKAFWLTEDEAYLREFVSTVKHWSKENKVDFGPNWTCAMEVAIRAINIIWGLYFFSAKSLLKDLFVQETIKLVYYHGLYIEKNLETIEDGANNNHLLSNYLGLFYIGLLFPEFDRSQKWRQLACEGLEKEIILETNSDGANYECSTSYHRLVLEIFLSAYILGKRNKYYFSESYKFALLNMLNFSEAITAQSGTTPFVGDNDDGFIVKLSHDNPASHTHLIELGAILFNRPLPKNIKRSEESIFYFKLQNEIVSRTKESTSSFFKQSGYATIRSKKMHLLFSAPRLTEKALGGHKHNDNLSFTLEYNKIRYFIDPGTYGYTSDFNIRNDNRSVVSHNTVSIDNEEQNKIIKSRPFFLYDSCHPEIDLYANLKDTILVSGFHHGFENDNILIQHRRTIQVNLLNDIVEISDEFTGDSQEEHLFKTRFITPIAKVVKQKNNQIDITEDRENYTTLNFDNYTDSEIEIRPSEYYPRYGVSKPAQIITRIQKEKLPLINKTTISLMHVTATNDRLKIINRINNKLDSVLTV